MMVYFFVVIYGELTVEFIFRLAVISEAIYLYIYFFVCFFYVVYFYLIYKNELTFVCLAKTRERLCRFD